MNNGIDKRQKRLLITNALAWYIYMIIVGMLRELSINSFIMSSFIFVTHGIFAYINFVYLIPRYLYKKKFLLFFIITILLIFFFLYLRVVFSSLVFNPELASYLHHIREYFTEPRVYLVIISNKHLLYFFLILLGTTSFKYFLLYKEKEKEALENKNAKLISELKFLKSQVNPHFLFNSLNNIYSLAISNSEMVPNQIVKLSDILRFIIYDAEENTIELNREIELIHNYIELQELKELSIKDRLTFRLEVDSNPLIEPMLLIPFVENALKHSNISAEEEAYVNMELVLRDGNLSFKVVNTFWDSKKMSQDSIGGIGLKNVKERLEILYRDNYSLDIDNHSGMFTINLKIKLNEKV
jgi:sensor histidine kinase YesM